MLNKKVRFSDEIKINYYNPNKFDNSVKSDNLIKFFIENKFLFMFLGIIIFLNIFFRGKKR